MLRRADTDINLMMISSLTALFLRSPQNIFKTYQFNQGFKVVLISFLLYSSRSSKINTAADRTHLFCGCLAISISSLLNTDINAVLCHLWLFFYVCFAAWILFFLIEEGFALAQRTKGKLELEFSSSVIVDSPVVKQSDSVP